MQTSASKTTLVMWIPAGTMMLVSLISYIDRSTLAVLSPTILKETGLSTESYGYIVAAFNVAYMAGNPLWGRFLDRFGLRAGMFGAVGFWTLASAAHAFAAGFWSFASARAALGFGEGATFPGGLRTSTQTLPLDKQSRGIAVSYSGGSLGAVVAPLIVIPIAARWGWRGAFLFTGLVGLVWLAIWNVVSRREVLRRVPDARLTDAAPIRWNDGRAWSFVIAYAFCALPLGFVANMAPVYLNRALHVSQGDLARVLWIPPFGWEIGYFFWGWVLDKTLNSGRESLGVFRRLFSLLIVLTLPLAIGARLPFSWALFELFFENFVAAGFVIGVVRYATGIFTTANAGLIAGLTAGGWGLAVAMVTPYLGRLFDQQRWETAFWICTAIPVLGFGIWNWLNRGGADLQASNA
jgi:MFS transporter, ACS family, hexuronate transporter